MRKILASSFVVTIILTIFSCEKDEVLKKCDKCLPIYIVYDNDNNDTISFTYNDHNQVMEISYANTYSPWAETFEYNESNQIIQYNEFRNGEQESYILYEYSENNLISSTEYRNTNNYDNLEDYKAYTPITYECDNEGKIVKLIENNYYISYKYDAKGNLSEQQKYSYLENEYLEYTMKRKFGNSYFYYKDLNLPINHHYRIYNNLTEQITEYYDIDGTVYNTNVLYMNYHAYNDYGYPTRVSKSSEDGVWLKYKEIVYLVIE
ncbi:MAG: hypothetical protein KAR57_05835 [Bacteroidales bacterium]|nr:hypothetical protein [Bacteroidales bacterium]